MLHYHNATGQETLQDHLETHRARLALAQRAGKIGTFEWDFSTDQILWTPELEALYGLSPGGFEGRYENWAQRVHPDDLASAEASVQEALAGEPHYDAEYRVIWPDGTYRWVVGKGEVQFDAQGKATKMIGVNIDITERKQAEEIRDAFMSIASHELRTPITTIKLNLQLLERRLHSLLMEQENLSPQARKAIDDMSALLTRAQRQVTVQNRLIAELLDVTRIQVNKLELKREEGDLATMVREAVEDQQQIVSDHSIHLELPEGVTVPVMVDRDRIEQTVSNYLSNALKYSPASVPVTVGLQVEEHHVRVWVRDQGPGLSKEVQQQVWQRFYQVEGTPVQSGFGRGLGLGLHICQTIIERHGGTVGVESTLGQGCTFWFTLPLQMSKKT